MTKNCPNCKTEMIALGRKTFQMGADNPFNLFDEHLMNGGLSFDIFVCPECRKSEFYLSPDEDTSLERYISWHRGPAPADSPMSDRDYICRKCGKTYEIEKIICPHCGHDFRDNYGIREEKREEPKPEKKKRRLPWEL